MPSWNIHTAHVERLLESREPSELGIADANVFLFGNYAPDIYLGFMVPETTFRVDYCLTHLALPGVTPVPDADLFWDNCVHKRRPKSAEGLSLALGAWAHLVADRAYNGRFRMFCQTHDVPEGDELRIRKQADFHLFGRMLGGSCQVAVTSELLEAARGFRPYSILPDDVERAAEVANAIVLDSAAPADGRGFQLLDERWMQETFDVCDERLRTWLCAWRQLEAEGDSPSAAEMRAVLGLAAATSDGAVL